MKQIRKVFSESFGNLGYCIPEDTEYRSAPFAYPYHPVDSRFFVFVSAMFRD